MVDGVSDKKVDFFKGGINGNFNNVNYDDHNSMEDDEDDDERRQIISSQADIV